LIVADFSFSNEGCRAPCLIEFNNESIGTVDRYTWDFGDDSIKITSDTIITHRYDEPGEYQVSLTASNGQDISEKTVFITISGTPSGGNNKNASITGISLLEFPLSKPDGSNWDVNSCCPDIEMRVWSVEQGKYLFTEEIVKNADSTPVSWSWGGVPIPVPNDEHLIVEFYDEDPNVSYEFIGKTDDFKLINFSNTKPPFIILDDDNVRVRIDLIWQ